ncbi:dATP/dGTP pyrophosphohydrolase domain-containing protein [Aestuariispira insulae]|uniref:Uncharacterized protein DUF550 n=1 Tax=Aestuariispira insulae TaxID=1461337 RepID=A0A3D9HYV3_9PROT|nr:dATP/dGTP pyrophosphohydrolase domain-containing protein [Aestuariispira insulae]RED54086.1 uncharacterized protein DUF550 [Aestuariispira insulae]
MSNRMENQASLAAWGEETFGPAADPVRLLERAELEMDELLEAARAGQDEEAALEAADILILLFRYAELSGFDLMEAVDRKMVVNRSRRWKPAGDGTGSHVKGG